MRARRRALRLRGSQSRNGASAKNSGSGSILAVAIVGACVLLSAALIPVLALLALGQAVQAAADAAALAAADTASGAVAGYPCEAAGTAAALNGASVGRCSVDGLIATVAVERRVAGFVLNARARAGPPPDAGTDAVSRVGGPP